LGLGDFHSVMANLNGLWSYALTDWLKLTIPNPSDHTRSRWPVHPLWVALASIDWETTGGPLLREYPQNDAPRFERIWALCFRAAVSFMAKTGCNELHTALNEVSEQTIGHIDKIAYILGVDFDKYVREKVELKRREYGTAHNGKPEVEPKSQADIDRDAARYRRASDGGTDD